MDIFQPQKRSVDLNLERDYISNMPPNVKEEVFIKLPIKEAVRTSILSTKWKYAWMSIPNLVFTEDCAQSELIRLVDQVLLVHHGPILQFKIISKHACNEAIGRWMLILSRNGIKNLHIKLGPSSNNRCMISSSFFSCLALEQVHIVCGNIYVPPSFLGFKFLRTLRLFDQFDVAGIVIAKLISSCPLLEILELSDICITDDPFDIHAPNLRWLSITGDFVGLCLETPKLLFAKIYRSGLFHDVCESVKKVLGTLSVIEELQLSSYFLALFDEDEECKPKVPFYQLTEFHIDFDYIYTTEVATAFCLFKSAPNLKLPNEDEVEDDASSLAQLFWELKGVESNIFSCLQIVKITYSIEYPETILKFAKFLLHTAPVLEKLVLREMKFRKETRSFLKKLASFPRVSKIVEIVFVERIPMM
ncbi:F-box/FBD/LRR-repeat protein At1g13570-like isoform X2 [Carex rostrata]